MNNSLTAETTLTNLIQQHYHLSPITHIEEVLLGLANRSFVVDTVEQKYFLQFNRLDGEFVVDLANTQFKTALLQWLKAQGFTQAIAPLPTCNGQLCIQPNGDGITYSLYEYRPHKLMYSEDPAINRAAAISFTEAIAHLHNLTRQQPALVGQPRSNTIQFLGWLREQRETFQQLQQALPHFAYADFHDAAPVQEIITATFARLEGYYQLIYEAPVDGKQTIVQSIYSLASTCCLVHDDLNPTNLSFTESGTLETLYDFDNAHWDIRVADVAYLYFYHYYSSPLPNRDYLDESLAEEMLARYEAATNSTLLPAERMLVHQLTLARILRAFLWLIGSLLRQRPLPLIAHGASRLRPQRSLPPARSVDEDVARTFRITFHAAERFASLVTMAAR